MGGAILMSSKGKTGGKNTGSGRFPGDPVNGKITYTKWGCGYLLGPKRPSNANSNLKEFFELARFHINSQRRDKRIIYWRMYACFSRIKATKMNRKSAKQRRRTQGGLKNEFAAKSRIFPG